MGHGGRSGTVAALVGQPGIESTGRAYNEKLAVLIGGFVKEGANGNSWVKTRGDVMPCLQDFLPRHEEVWRDAMKEYIQDCCSAVPA
jgi:hypothetical protein